MRYTSRDATWDRAEARIIDPDGMPHDLPALRLFDILRRAADLMEEESPGGAPVIEVSRYLEAVGNAAVVLVRARDKLREVKGLDPLVPPGSFSADPESTKPPTSVN